MKFDDKFPDQPTTLGQHDIAVCGSNFVRTKEKQPCWNCQEPTGWIDLNFEAFLCSEECATKKWKEFAEAYNRGFLDECIEYFGKEKQIMVCIEEMAELTQQLCKFNIDHPKKSREKLVEEYTDVLIMLNQMKIIFEISDEEVDAVRRFKFERLKNFMESNKL